MRRQRPYGDAKDLGLAGLHFHDLHHTGNMLAAMSGAGLKDLMAWMGHDNIRAAMIYQHAVSCPLVTALNGTAIRLSTSIVATMKA
jgi:integrase